MENTLIQRIVGAVLLVAMFVLFVLPAREVQAQDTSPGFHVMQKVRNLTKKDFNWMDALKADPGDRIEFQVTVIWQGSQPTQNVLVRETLSEKLVYADNLKIDGTSLVGDITKENVNIGQLTSDQPKIVSFEAEVVPTESLDIGTSNLVNTVTVFNTDGGASGTALVQAQRVGSPTDVSTGPLSIWVIPFVLLFTIVFIGSYIFFFKYYLTHEVVRSKYETRTDRKLATMIEDLKKKERGLVQ